MAALERTSLEKKKKEKPKKNPVVHVVLHFYGPGVEAGRFLLRDRGFPTSTETVSYGVSTDPVSVKITLSWLHERVIRFGLALTRQAGKRTVVGLSPLRLSVSFFLL